MADQASIAKVHVALECADSLDSGDRPTVGMEHRLGSRMSVSLTVTLHHAGRTEPGRMLNVSLSGAYVQTSADLKLLTRIGVMCEHASSAAAGAPCVTAFVTRVAAGGVALEWLEFAPAAIRHLMRREPPQETRRIAAAAAAARAPAAITASSRVSNPLPVL